MAFDWTVAVCALATAIIVQDRPRLQVGANISPIANDTFPVIAILAQVLSDAPA